MKEFFNKFVGFSIGPIIGGIIGFVTVPLTSNLISPDQFGLASMFNLANTILTLVVLIGIDQAYMREFNEHSNKSELLFNCMLIPIVNTFIIAFILLIFDKFWAKLLFDNPLLTRPIIMLAICSPLFIIEKFMLLSIRMEEKAVKYSLCNVFTKLVYLICLILLLVYYKRDFESVIYATILSQFIVSVILIFICRKNIRLSINSLNKSLIIKTLKFGLPLVPATLIGYALNSADTIFLRYMTDYTELGYYSVALRLANVLALIQTSFSTFWAPIAFKWKHNNYDLKKFELVSKGITLVMSIVLIGILIVKNLIPILLSKDYNRVIYILPFLLFNPIFYTMSETTTLGISFSRKTGYNIIVSTFSMLVNILLNTAFIPRFGAIGAAIATGISYIAFFWARTLISRKLWYKFPIKHFVLTTIILFLIALLNILIKNILYIEFLNICSICIICYIYFDVIKYIYRLVKKENKKERFNIGLICFETQKEQLLNLINSDNINIIDLNYSKVGKLKKLFLLLKNIKNIDLFYFGYGAYSLNYYLIIAKIFRKKVLCHWIGTDVLKAKENKKFKNVIKYIDTNLSCSELIKKELAELGVPSKEIPIIPKEISKNYSKTPSQHAILAYLPEGKEEFYGLEYVKYAAEKYTNINFYIVGNAKNEILNSSNVKFLGNLSQGEMDELYDKITVLMRIPKHDGLSLMLLEALSKGKEVLYCYDFPGVRVIKSKLDVDIALKSILNVKPIANKVGHDYVQKNYCIEDIRKKLNKILLSVLKGEEV